MATSEVPAPIRALIKQCAQAAAAKDWPLCEAAARQVLALRPTHPRARLHLAGALFNRNQLAAAATECTQVAPTNEQMLRHVSALQNSCKLLLGLRNSDDTNAPGARLRAGWYRARIEELVAEGELTELELGQYRRLKLDEEGQVPGGPVGLDDCMLLSGGEHWAAGAQDVRGGGDGGERQLAAGLFHGFPLDQACGGTVYLKQCIIPLHCNSLLRERGQGCYTTGHGPCTRCAYDKAIPLHRFPKLAAHMPTGRVIRPHASMDVLYSTDAVSSEVRSVLCDRLHKLADKRPDYPMPQYHNIVDPNIGSSNGLWVPTEFDAVGALSLPVAILRQLEKACVTLCGGELPSALCHQIVLAAGFGRTIAHSVFRTQIPDLDPRKHCSTYCAIQSIMDAALPMLGMLNRPSLLLPGPLQAAVKVQRIVLAKGEEYSGLWHEDGLNESVVAVVLYYYHASESLTGGSLEFCSKQTMAMWTGDAGGPDLDRNNAHNFVNTLPRCKVPVKSGTLVVFSNYQSVHRVLRMVAEKDGGSRDFVAFFVIDQQKPLPTPRLETLAPYEVRQENRFKMLQDQLQPKGQFGLGQQQGVHVYSTGNGSVADVGWIRKHGDIQMRGKEEQAASNMFKRLNLKPSTLQRGLSSALDDVPAAAFEAENWEYDCESPWVECLIGEEVVYYHQEWLEVRSCVSNTNAGIGSVQTFESKDACVEWLSNRGGAWYGHEDEDEDECRRLAQFVV